MPTAFLRSPADSLAGVAIKDKMRRRRRGLLLMEDGDQDFGPATGPRVRAGDGNVGGGTPQRYNLGSAEEGGRAIKRRGQDTTTTGGPKVAQFQGKTGSVGQEPTDKQTPPFEPLDKSGQKVSRDVGGSTAPQGEKERTPMTAGEVQSALHKMVWDAIEYVDQELSPYRAMATKYYQGEPFGNEEEGRSQFVNTDLRDTILQIMPSLLRIFLSPERAIEFSPLRPDQVEMAEQATEYMWEVVFHEDNHGELEMWNAFKDALIKRLGIWKYWYDDTIETRTFSNSFMTDDQLTLLQQNSEIRIESVTPTQSAPPGNYDVEYTQTKKSGQLRFYAMPPEEYLFTRGARVVSSDHWYPGVALFVGHRTELMRSQLLEIGVPEDVIEAWAFKDVSLDHNQEEIARQHIVKPDTSTIGPIATQKALYIEGYPYLDVDGDGVAELRKVIMLGPSYHVINGDGLGEPCDERPFAVLMPDPEPHTIIGQSVSDYTMDIQKTSSSVWRATFDSLALALNNRLVYVEGEANLNDIMNPEVGAPIRARQLEAVREIAHTFVGAQSLPVLDKLQEIKEARTGITRSSAGLDADALQSTTKAAVAAQVTAAQAHTETLARLLAIGVAQLFRGLYRQLCAHPPRARMVKMRGKYVEMDPQAWDANLPVKIKVAVGAGLDEERYQALTDIAAKMEGIFNTMGPANPIVTLRQYRDVLVRMAKRRGFVDAESMFNEVDPKWQPPPQQPNDPQMVVAMAEKQKADAHVQKLQADQQIDQAKHQSEVQKHQVDQQLKDKDIMLTDKRERDRMELEFQLKVREMELQHQLKMDEIRMTAETERMKAAAEQQSRRVEAEANADARRDEGKAAIKAADNGGEDDKK